MRRWQIGSLLGLSDHGWAMFVLDVDIRDADPDRGECRKFASRTVPSAETMLLMGLVPLGRLP